MRMRHVAWAIALLIVPAVASAGSRHNLSFTTNTDDDKPILTCDDLDMKFWKDDFDKDTYANARRSETITLPKSGSTPLVVRAPDHGGIRVQPSSDGKASALICMVAGAKSMSAAEALLGKIVVRMQGNELTLSGPEDEAWGACIVISVPKDASLDLRAMNGGLSLRDVSGRFTLSTTNGPISLAGVSGVVDGEAVNGPISFRGHAGDIRLSAENGPIQVKLDAPAWTGKGLRASTTNGPVAFSAPSDLRSGVQVEGSAHSPFIWNGSSRPTYDEWRRAHSVWLGEGPTVIHVSTVNGPVDIRAPKAKSEKSSKSKSI